MLTKIVKTILKLFYGIKMFPLRKSFASHSKDSNNVVVVYPNRWKDVVQYFYSDSFLSDLALIAAVVDLKGDFRLRFGLRKLNDFQGKLIFFNMSERFNLSGYQNYTNSILNFVDQMEEQRNICIPNRRDVEFWENKVFMHEQFDECGVNAPRTDILRFADKVPKDLEYPLILKEVHSKGAEGVYKINSYKELKDKLAVPSIWRDNNELLVQQFLNIRTDIRIVFIGGELMYYHWRFNEKKSEWEPTTYKKGTTADFYNFPEQWREIITEEFTKLDMVSGAFDIAWDNDDYNSMPLVLEVSPSFFPNPRPPKDHHIPYGDYKHKLHLKDSWEKHYISNVYRIKKKQIESYLKASNNSDK